MMHSWQREIEGISSTMTTMTVIAMTMMRTMKMTMTKTRKMTIDAETNLMVRFIPGGERRGSSGISAR